MLWSGMDQSLLNTHKKTVEEFLAKVLPEQQFASHKFYGALTYAVLNGGKRLRPLLVYTAGQALNVQPERLHAAAAAVELVHCYSLVHDDLPAMDDDDLRRGLPTCHKAFNEATAILAGDALQSLAFQTLANGEDNPNSAEQRIAMVLALAKAIGCNGMVLGQAEDMAAEYKQLTLSELITLHQHKTGELFKVCVELAWIVSESQDLAILDALINYSYSFGLAFQIQDDILDVTADTAIIGKPAGSDLKSHKATFTQLFGLEEAKNQVTLNLTKASAALQPLGTNGYILRELAESLIDREY